MKHKFLHSIFLFISIYFSYSIDAKANKDYLILSDSAQISILTNSPWDKEIYALFGHTVIRVNDPANKIDYAFNYGTFDFESPNFMWRFVTGETDYKVTVYDMFIYLAEYKCRGVKVSEQILNLNQEEKQNIWVALLTNIQPDNSIYRYNFLYDNCATRPRDIIEQNINGTIIYTPSNKDQTYRDLIHECVNIKPWVRFGIDLIIGSDADKIITDRQKDFLPKYLSDAYKKSTIRDLQGKEKILVKSSSVLLKSINNNPLNEKPIDTPLITGYIILFFAIIVSIYAYKKNKLIIGKIFDTILFITAGLLGCIIFFLMFFSEHPCVNPNWNLIWLHPLHLLIGCLFFVKPLVKYIYYYHFINFAALLLFFLAWVLIPQQLEIAFIPYLLTILLRSGMNIVITKKNRKQAYNLFIK